MNHLIFFASLVSVSVALVSVGGSREYSTDEALDKIKSGLEQINAAHSSNIFLVPVKVNKASRQVVAGTKYVWEVEMAETKCNKFSRIARTACVAIPNKSSIYKITLWEKPWENFAQYTVVPLH